MKYRHNIAEGILWQTELERAKINIKTSSSYYSNSIDIPFIMLLSLFLVSGFMLGSIAKMLMCKLAIHRHANRES
jgi:hypothetical protein